MGLLTSARFYYNGPSYNYASDNYGYSSRESLFRFVRFDKFYLEAGLSVRYIFKAKKDGGES